MHVGAETAGVAGPEARDLAPFRVEVAAKLAGNINHAAASRVIAEDQHVVQRPYVVNAAFGNFVVSDFLRMLDVAHVHHVADAAHRDAFLAVDIEQRGKNFVTNEDVILVAKRGVRAGEPVVSVELEVIVLILRNELRMLGAAAFDSVADVENDHAVAPIGEVG